MPVLTDKYLNLSRKIKIIFSAHRGKKAFDKRRTNREKNLEIMGKNLLERRARIKENRKVTKGGFEGEKNRGKTY